MQPTTLRFSQNTLDKLADEAEAYGFSNRSEYVRWIVSNRSAIVSNTQRSGTDIGPNTETVDNLRERIAALEARVDDLEGESRMPKGRGETAETAVERRAETPESEEPARERVRERVREHIGDGPPRKSHARDALVEAVALLADRGPLATAELKDALWEKYGEHYSTERTMWNSLDRHLEEIPGVSKPGYGEWDVDVGELRKAD